MNTKQSLMLCIVFLLLLPSALSLGIAPAKREFEYAPEKVQRYDIKIVNNERKDMDVLLSVDGVLHEYIKFEQGRVQFRADEGEKAISYTVTIPDNLEPGVNQGRIIAEETIPSVRFGESFVTAKLTVTSQLEVQVPYPEKYVEARLDVLSKADVVDLKADVINRGLNDIEQLSGSFGIFDGDTQLSSLPQKARSLKRAASDELLATFKTADVKPGLYSAVATIGFDDKSVRLIKDFQVGKPFVKVNDFDKYFVQNQINEFKVDIESIWNKQLQNVYAQTYIFQNGKEITSFKGITFDMKPEERTRTTLYFNAQGLAAGEYQAVVVVNYNGETSKKEEKIFIMTKEEYDTKFKQSDTTFYLLVALVVLVAIFIIFLVVALVLYTKANKK